MSKLYYVMVEYNPETDSFVIGQDMVRRHNSYVWDQEWVNNEEESLEYTPTDEEVDKIVEIENRLRYII